MSGVRFPSRAPHKETVMKQGDKVVVKHQPELGELEVKVAKEPTDIKRVGGEPVGYYVRVGEKYLGYHEDSLEVVTAA